MSTLSEDSEQDPSAAAPGFLTVTTFVWGYWRRVPLMFSAIVCGVILSVALEVQIPERAAELVSALQRHYEAGASLDQAWHAMYWLVGTFAAMSLVSQAYLRVWMWLASGVMRNLVFDGFERVQRFSSEWHANNFAGATVRKITRGMNAYDSYADTLLIDLAPAVSILIGFAIAMLLRDPVMGGYFIVTVALFLTLSITLSLRYVAPANQRLNAADTELGANLADAVTCNAVVKTFGSEEREDSRFATTAEQWRTLARKAWTRSMDSGALQSLFILLMLSGLLTIVLLQAERGAAALADLVYVLTTYFIVNGYLRNIGWMVRNLQRSANELEDLVSIRATPPQIADAPAAAVLEPDLGAIRFDNVSFRYPRQAQPVLSQFNLKIAPGEKIALVGESGAGKSTLVKLLQRLHDLDAGQILIDGQDIASVTQASLRSSIALVPQDPVLFHRTLAENIAYGRPSASPAEIEAAARQAHAHAFIASLPEGYETMVGERGVKLSGGERQRVAIARAILAAAPILILDEATSSLDSATELMIQEAIANLTKGRTSVIIAHRLSTVRQCDRILVFERGRVVEQGDHRSLMRIEDGVYRNLFDIQAGGLAASV
ncbi:MAG: ABC transporter ATP-binding protein [Pseudomonadota bacterium]